MLNIDLVMNYGLYFCLKDLSLYTDYLFNYRGEKTNIVKLNDFYLRLDINMKKGIIKLLLRLF